MKDVKPRILLLLPGPEYKIKALFQRRLVNLSKHFQGALVTISDNDECLQIGEFEVLSIGSDAPTSMKSTVKMFRKANELMKMYKAQGNPIKLLVAYDPLKIGLMGVLLVKLNKCRLAVEVNGDFASDANYLDYKSVFKRRIKKFIMLLNEWFVLRFATGAKLLFDRQLDHFSGAISIPVVRVFPNYVDLSNFKPGVQLKEILIAGFPFKIKGIDILIAAFKRVAVDFPDWKLKILGWFPQIQELNSHIDGNSQIFHHPPVYFDEMPAHMSAASIFALPSRTEAMGRVLLEAASCGVARIGSNIGGIPKVIGDKVDGLLFESENIEELATKLSLLMGDESYRKKIAEAGIKRAGSDFSGEKYFEQCASFYNNVINY